MEWRLKQLGATWGPCSPGVSVTRWTERPADEVKLEPELEVETEPEKAAPPVRRGR